LEITCLSHSLPSSILHKFNYRLSEIERADKVNDDWIIDRNTAGTTVPLKFHSRTSIRATQHTACSKPSCRTGKEEGRVVQAKWTSQWEFATCWKWNALEHWNMCISFPTTGSSS
jgi:hypothetical protein